MLGWLKLKSRFGNVAGRFTVQSEERNQPGTISSSDHASLLLEGTSFAMFVDEDLFFQACRDLNQAALKISFKEFWPVGRRGTAQKAIGGGLRLLCAGCFNEMPFSFQMALPGGGMGSMIMVGGMDYQSTSLVQNRPHALRAVQPGGLLFGTTRHLEKSPSGTWIRYASCGASAAFSGGPGTIARRVFVIAVGRKAFREAKDT